MRTVEQRFENFVIPEPNTGCHLWLGALTNDGHGKFWVDGKLVLAHRHSYEASIGPIPCGMIVRHSCDLPCCVNDQHLLLRTNADNADDMVRRGRSVRGHLVKGAKLMVDDVIAIRNSSGSLKQIGSKRRTMSPTSGVGNVGPGYRWRQQLCDVRFRGNSGKHLLSLSFSGFGRVEMWRGGVR